MARLALTKCHGAGNDFLILDRFAGDDGALPAIARYLCDRHRGVGADGLLVLEPPATSDADLQMRIFNADGSEAEMCGNGVRCVARYRFDRTGGATTRLAIATRAGLVRADVVETKPHFSVRVAMDAPSSVAPWDEPSTLCGHSVRGADVTLGNPHTVLFVDVEPEAIELDAMAAAVLERTEHRDGVNVEVVRIADGMLRMRIFERGVGETMACGTGACAAATSAIASRVASSPVTVTMPGGDVVVEWNGGHAPMFLTGGAEIVFNTDVDVPDSLLVRSGALHA